jgi:hypothetical protein
VNIQPTVVSTDAYRAQRSPLSLGAEQSLVNLFGLIGFSREYVRRAIEDRYLRTPSKRETAHIRLADYFDVRE